jgi:hypothetical protein
LAKGKGFEGGFPESSGLGNYRIGNMGEKRKPEPEIQIDQSEEKSPFMVNQGIQIDQRREKPSNNQKASKDSESSKIDLGVYQAHILQIFKKLPVQLVQ